MPDRFDLHRARLQKGVGLAHISSSTALNPAMATLIDEGRFEELPAGIYARSYVRTFARAVGIPPDEALAAVQEFLRPSEDPLPTLLGRAPKSPFEGFWTFIAGQAKPCPALSGLIRDASIRRVGAGAIDALLLTSVGLTMICGTALIAGTRVQRLLEIAGPELALMFSVPVGLYFMLLEGLHVPTLGKVVCGSGRSTLHGRGVRIRHCAYGRHRTTRFDTAATRRDAGRHDRGAEHLALRSAPARR